MHNVFHNWSPLRILAALNGGLILLYLGLIAFVMSYAAMHVEYAQSLRETQAAVGTLEAKYLAQVSGITTTDYAALGYQKPLSQAFVPSTPTAAINIR